MKKILLCLTVFMMLSVLILSGCNNQDGDTSSLESSLENSSQSETSKPSKDKTPKDAVVLRFTRYTNEKDTFVMIGTCADNAYVTAQLDDQTVTVKSYHGWFSASFTKKGATHKVTFTQTVNGEPYDIPRNYTAVPVTSSRVDEQGVIASNQDFQFFLSKMIANYEGKNLYNQTALDNMKKTVGNRLDTLKANNPDGEIIYLIVPSAMTIYPELVPDCYKQTDGETRLDQVTNALTEAGATVIDVRDTFNQHKNDEMPLYYKMDSHWADYGAYLAYVELFNHISQKFPEATPRQIDDFDWIADDYQSADAIMYLDIDTTKITEYGYFRNFKSSLNVNQNILSVPRYRLPQLLYSDDCTAQFNFNTGNQNLPSCIVHRDSYGAGIFDLIPERMNKTHYVGMWNYAWDNYKIQNQKPDYVIYILAEWNLDNVVFK